MFFDSVVRTRRCESGGCMPSRPDAVSGPAAASPFRIGGPRDPTHS